jgi:NADH:ubiquinone oxidoreductase subunit E
MAALSLEAAVLNNRQGQPHELVEVLLDVQDTLGHIPEEAMRLISERLHVPLVEVCAVANFYKAISLRPRGQHTCTVCMGTACHVRGSPLLLDELSNQLDVQPGQTTPDGQFTLERVNCVGACALGPVVIADNVYHHHVSPAKLRKLVKSIQNQ